MGQIHDLVTRHGRLEARKLVAADEAKLVDLAAEVLGDENATMGFTYSGFCMASLPHRALETNKEWMRKSDDFSLVIEPGKLFKHGEDVGTEYGVPYGPRARMILLYLQSEAIRTNSREVERGASMNRWLNRMEIGVGGKTYRAFREQELRISACRLTFAFKRGNREGFMRDSIIDGAMNLFDPNDDGSQGRLWRETVLLGENFFKSLKEHPVPLWDGAIARLANQSLAIDIYCWLAYRLHVLNKPTSLSWQAVFRQFGASYTELRHFRPRFIDSLKTAMAVYPDARVTIDDEAGLMLHPSPAPVSARKFVG